MVHSYILIKQLDACLSRSLLVARDLAGNRISTTWGLGGGGDRDSGVLIPSSLQLLEASMCPVRWMIIPQYLLFTGAPLTKRTSGFQIATKKSGLKKVPRMQALKYDKEGTELQHLLPQDEILSVMLYYLKKKKSDDEHRSVKKLKQKPIKLSKRLLK